MLRPTRWIWLVGLLALAGCRKVASYEPARDATTDAVTIDGAIADGAIADGAIEDGAIEDGAVDRGLPTDGEGEGAGDGAGDGAGGDLREAGFPADGRSDVVRDQAIGPPPLPLPPLVDCGPGKWCWQHPLPQGNDLYGLFCTKNGECFAVGDAGALLHRPVGGPWQLRQSGTDGKLRAVWVDEATRTIVVVGGDQVRRWTSAGWVSTTQADHPDLTSVWGLSPSEFYVGAPANPTAPARQGLWRFDTVKFTRLESEPVVDLWGDGTKIYALLPHAIKVADGTSFAAAPYGSLGSCPSIGAGAAVAFAPLSTSPPSTFFVLTSVSNAIYQLSPGGCATFATSPVAGEAIVSIANEVFVASDKDIQRYAPTLGGWQSAYPASAAVHRLFPVGGGAHAVGALGGLYEGGSGGWQEESKRKTTRRLWAVAMVATSLFAAGDNGTLLEQVNGTWATKSTNLVNTSHLYALAGNASELRAVSAAGEFVTYLPPPETRQTVAAGKRLYALRSAGSGYLLGGENTLLLCDNGCSPAFGAYTGTVRAGQLLGQDAIVASSDETGGGEAPAFVRIVPSPRQVLPQVDGNGQAISVALYGLWGTGTEMRAVGFGGTVLLRGNNNDEWTTETTPSDAKGRLLAIAGRNSNELWAVGEGGLILGRSNTNGWTRQPFVARQSLTGVAVDQNNGQAWAVGAGGAILHYTRTP